MDTITAQILLLLMLRGGGHLLPCKHSRASGGQSGGHGEARKELPEENEWQNFPAEPAWALRGRKGMAGQHPSPLGTPSTDGTRRISAANIYVSIQMHGSKPTL